MTDRKPHTFRTNAIGFAIASMLLAASAQAGVINNSNPDTAPGAFLGDCGTVGNPVACVGAMHLGNVDVKLVRTVDGTEFGTFEAASGVYSAMALGDSFVSTIKDAAGAVMAKLTGKVWPVGEPVGIKAVTGDAKVTKGKPQNCLINTAFMGEGESTSGLSAYLDTAHPEPVICSSPFQTHKRFKIAMQPATVDGVANGAESDKPIDMVFNVADSGGLQAYQVFSKINNYTGKRLKGYKILVGQGLGAAFQSASTLGIADKLHISLGKGEGASGNGTLDGSDLFDGDGLATFSHGLFGAPDQHFTTNGFFDTRTAGFEVAQTCSVLPCNTHASPFAGGAALMDSDTIYSTAVLPSNYAGPVAAPLTAPLFGDWLPSIWQPKGIFFDDDGDPTTDAQLVAWWDGSAWRKNNDSGFAVVSDAEFATWKADPLYAIDDIEDVLNLGINYIVKVGDGIADTNGDAQGDFTIRIIPVVADTQDAPTYVGTTPTPLVDPIVPPPVVTPPVTDGGGCTAASGKVPFDPMMPLLATLGLAGWAVRRAKRR